LLISLAAVITWIIQFYVKLWDNVLIREDRSAVHYIAKLNILMSSPNFERI
jgi:hypothetical protein